MMNDLSVKVCTIIVWIKNIYLIKTPCLINSQGHIHTIRPYACQKDISTTADLIASEDNAVKN
jgi:hypothetical protein